MRTNIDIDEELLRRAIEASGEPTKRATVEAALRMTVLLKKQEAIRDLFGTVQWDGDLDAMREGRIAGSDPAGAEFAAEGRGAAGGAD